MEPVPCSARMLAFVLEATGELFVVARFVLALFGLKQIHALKDYETKYRLDLRYTKRYQLLALKDQFPSAFHARTPRLTMLSVSDCAMFLMSRALECPKRFPPTRVDAVLSVLHKTLTRYTDKLPPQPEPDPRPEPDRLMVEVMDGMWDCRLESLPDDVDWI